MYRVLVVLYQTLFFLNTKCAIHDLEKNIVFSLFDVFSTFIFNYFFLPFLFIFNSVTVSNRGGPATHQASKPAHDVALEKGSLISSLSCQTGVRGIRRKGCEGERLANKL
jgi:bacteriorhodopsin